MLPADVRFRRVKQTSLEPSTNVFNTSPVKGEMALAALPPPVEKYLFGRARGGNRKPQASRNSIVPK